MLVGLVVRLVVVTGSSVVVMGSSVVVMGLLVVVVGSIVVVVGSIVVGSCVLVRVIGDLVVVTPEHKLHVF